MVTWRGCLAQYGRPDKRRALKYNMEGTDPLHAAYHFMDSEWNWKVKWWRRTKKTRYTDGCGTIDQFWRRWWRRTNFPQAWYVADVLRQVVSVP
jgi:hypothetical protein